MVIFNYQRITIQELGWKKPEFPMNGDFTARQVGASPMTLSGLDLRKCGNLYSISCKNSAINNCMTNFLLWISKFGRCFFRMVKMGLSWDLAHNFRLVDLAHSASRWSWQYRDLRGILGRRHLGRDGILWRDGQDLGLGHWWDAADPERAQRFGAFGVFFTLSRRRGGKKRDVLFWIHDFLDIFGVYLKIIK